MKQFLPVLAALLLAGFTAQSHAHGDEKTHGKAVAMAKEQKEWGIAGDAGAVTQTVTLTMDDNMRFRPDKLKFKQGETVRFVIRNQGKLQHELVIGTQKELDEHAALMLKFPAMAHDEPYMAHVAPGKRASLIWTFNRAGDFNFACLIAGHYQAGMVGRISVIDASR